MNPLLKMMTMMLTALFALTSASVPVWAGPAASAPATARDAPECRGVGAPSGGQRKARTVVLPGTVAPVEVHCIGLNAAVSSVAVASVAATAPALAASRPASEAVVDPPDLASVEAAMARQALLTEATWMARILGVAALALLILAVWQANGNAGIRFTSHWGGFGGSGTGWHLTPAAVSLVAAALLALSAAAVVMSLLQATKPGDVTKSTTSRSDPTVKR